MRSSPTEEPEDRTEQEPDLVLGSSVDKPAIVASVGSSAVGSTTGGEIAQDDDVEPQQDRHPDNDGETIEE